MEEQRKNNTEEIKLFSAVFKISKTTIITFISLMVASLATAIVGLIVGIHKINKIKKSYYYWYYGKPKFEGTPLVLFIVGLSILVLLGIILLAKLLLVKKNSCTVTNKRILGTRVRGLVTKTFSYRLDKIDKSEAISCLGSRYVKFEFSKGSVGVNPIYYQTPKMEHFTLTNVHNHLEFHENLSKLIVCVKNDSDVVVNLANSFADKD